MKKAISLLFTSLLIINFGVSRVFAEEEDTDLFFDDVADQLIDITSDVNQSGLQFVIDRSVVIDSAVSFANSLRFETTGINTIAFTGNYYDNTITSITACNSSTYQYQTIQQTVDSAMVVEPALYGSLGHSSDNIAVNFGITVNSAYSGNVGYNTSSFENTSQACNLIGMNSGDGGIDGATLLAAGYEKKTITYNDGSTNGHTATFYVPGNESLSLSTDDFDDLIEAIYARVLNSLTVDYHYQYDFYLTGNQNMSQPVPSYGYLRTRAWTPMMVYWTDVFYSASDPVAFLEEIRMVQDTSRGADHTFYEGNASSPFSYTNNGYQYTNSSYFYWSGTDNPHWYFRGMQKREVLDLNDSNGSMNTSPLFTPYQIRSFYLSDNNGAGVSQNYYTVTASDVEKNPNLTAGLQVPVYGFATVAFYKLQDSSRLSLFNQLGSFLQNQFDRLRSAIQGIDPSGSTDITNEIENNYNIDTDLQINNYLQNIKDRDENIDLTAPEFTLPDQNNLQLLSDIPLRTLNIFFSNGLGWMIFVPIIIAILGLVL